MNPLKTITKELDEYFIPINELYPKAYNKNSTGPYSKLNVILANGTEFESVWFMHQFARHTDNKEILEKLAIIRTQEQQQQKRISCLKPLNESILETTIAYEQLAVELTASLAKREKDKTNKQALDFALLEDFDHLYRFSNMLLIDKGIEAERLVGKYTEIMPGRPTIAEYRYPSDNLSEHMISKKADLFSKLTGCIITAAEQQTMNYYMNIAQWYKNDLGRKLYAEIGMVEEEHVTQYESLKDPNLTWLEQWAMHEYAECYLYYSLTESEQDPYLKGIWESHYDMECCHLKTVVELLDKYEKTPYTNVFGDGEFPEALMFGNNKEYIREVIYETLNLTKQQNKYINVDDLNKASKFKFYQDHFIGKNEDKVASHMIINKAIEMFGEDYRYQESKHPIKALSSRKSDNTSIAR